MLEKVHIRVDRYLRVYYNIYLLTDGRWGCLSYLVPYMHSKHAIIIQVGNG